MSQIDLLFTIAGAGALLAAMLPRVVEGRPLSLPMVFMAGGVLLYLTPLGLPPPDPVAHRATVEHATEICVIISLMGAGLAIDRPAGRRSWSTTWRLLGITMPLTIAAVALSAYFLLGWPPAAALLLGAVLAPTDPVLASDVQVAEPTGGGTGTGPAAEGTQPTPPTQPTRAAEGAEGAGTAVATAQTGEDEVRFGLTSEAGLNDGLAFPVVFAAIALAAAPRTDPTGWMGEWALFDLLYRCGVGVACGSLIGLLLGRLFFHSGTLGLRLAEYREGFVAVAATFLSYGVTESLHGYGFIAVFTTACGIRAAERTHGYHGVLHGFIEQVERLFTAWLLLVLGGFVATGGLGALTWRGAGVALLLLLLIRPVSGWLAQVRGPASRRERRVAAFFGIRGIGSLFYLAYALGQTGFGVPARELWAVVAFTVLLSVAVHGAAAGPIMTRLDLRREHRRRRTLRDAAPRGGRRPRARDRLHAEHDTGLPGENRLFVRSGGQPGESPAPALLRRGPIPPPA